MGAEEAGITRSNFCHLLLTYSNLKQLTPLIRLLCQDGRHGREAVGVLVDCWVRLKERGVPHLRRIVEVFVPATGLPMLKLQGVEKPVHGENISDTNPFIDDVLYEETGRAELRRLQDELATLRQAATGGSLKPAGVDLLDSAAAVWRKQVATASAQQLDRLACGDLAGIVLADMKDKRSIAEVAAALDSLMPRSPCKGGQRRTVGPAGPVAGPARPRLPRPHALPAPAPAQRATDPDAQCSRKGMQQAPPPQEQQLQCQLSPDPAFWESLQRAVSMARCDGSASQQPCLPPPMHRHPSLQHDRQHAQQQGEPDVDPPADPIRLQQQQGPEAQLAGSAAPADAAAAAQAAPAGQKQPPQRFTLVVANLGVSMDGATLARYFRERYPSVLSAKVPTEAGGTPRGYGLVHFSSDAERRRAVADMDGHVLPGGTRIGTGLVGSTAPAAAPAEQLSGPILDPPKAGPAGQEAAQPPAQASGLRPAGGVQQAEQRPGAEPEPARPCRRLAATPGGQAAAAAGRAGAPDSKISSFPCSRLVSSAFPAAAVRLGAMQARQVAWPGPVAPLVSGGLACLPSSASMLQPSSMLWPAAAMQPMFAGAVPGWHLAGWSMPGCRPAPPPSPPLPPPPPPVRPRNSGNSSCDPQQNDLPGSGAGTGSAVAAAADDSSAGEPRPRRRGRSRSRDRDSAGPQRRSCSRDRRRSRGRGGGGSRRDDDARRPPGERHVMRSRSRGRSPEPGHPAWLLPLLKAGCKACVVDHGLPFPADRLLKQLDELRGQRGSLLSAGLSLRGMCDFLERRRLARVEARREGLWVTRILPPMHQ